MTTFEYPIVYLNLTKDEMPISLNLQSVLVDGERLWYEIKNVDDGGKIVVVYCKEFIQ